MALLKDEVLYNGKAMNYHRIGEFTFDEATQTAGAVLYSFGSEAERVANRAPLLKRTYSYTHLPEGDHFEEAYAAICSRPEWEGAISV